MARRPNGYLLVRLSPCEGNGSTGIALITPPGTEVARLTDVVPVTLSESGALLLDQAEWRVDDGKWQPREEILRLDNLARQQMGLAPRSGKIVQPWADTTENSAYGSLSLRFRILSDVAVAQLCWHSNTPKAPR